MAKDKMATLKKLADAEKKEEVSDYIVIFEWNCGVWYLRSG